MTDPIYKEETPTMDKYGKDIRDYWVRWAPTRLATLENPDAYFEELGATVGAQIEQLSIQLAGPDPKDEGYLEKVARLTAARRQAEEIVMNEVDWPPIEKSADETREDWEMEEPRADWLVDWAHRAASEREYYERMGDVGGPDLEDMAEKWLLPVPFLEGLAAAPSPWTYLEEHSEVVTAAKEARYQAYLKTL